MKRHIAILLLGLLFSCKKEGADPETPAGMLYQITANKKVHESFQYQNGRVTENKVYGFCDTPYLIVEYGFSGDRLQTVKSSSRGLYSSSSGAMCDASAAYDVQTSSIELDAQQRLSKIRLGQTLVEYEYKGTEATFVVKDASGTELRKHRLKFDANGNLTEERTPDPVNGGVTRYEYDDRPNPLYGMRLLATGVSAFNGKNNVIRAFDASGKLLWERKFTYDKQGRPATCAESNGQTYEYHYR